MFISTSENINAQNSKRYNRTIIVKKDNKCISSTRVHYKNQNTRLLHYLKEQLLTIKETVTIIKEIDFTRTLMLDILQ